MITLTDNEIEGKYKMGHAIDDVKNILNDYKNDQMVESIRTVLPAGDDNSMLYMPCISIASQVLSLKLFQFFR